MKKTIGLLLAVFMLSVLAACGQGKEEPTSTQKPDPTADVKSLTGHIVIAEDGLHFDEVEIVTRNDRDRIEALGLEEQKDYPNGCAIVNEEQKEEVFPFSDAAQFEFVDVDLKFLDESKKDGDRVYQTNDVQEFVRHLGQRNDTPLAEQTIPYFVEVQDGTVIRIVEKLEYTM